MKDSKYVFLSGFYEVRIETNWKIIDAGTYFYTRDVYRKLNIHTFILHNLLINVIPIVPLYAIVINNLVSMPLNFMKQATGIKTSNGYVICIIIESHIHQHISWMLICLERENFTETITNCGGFSAYHSRYINSIHVV